MSTRSTRRPQVQIPLSPLESLLLAQATWELGASSHSWPAIAKLLSKHPLLSRPKSFFSAQSCHSMYEQLMKDAELEITGLNETPHSPMNLKLAEKHFRSRHSELRELILAEEVKFKAIVKEIDAIRSGLWDEINETTAVEVATAFEPPARNADEERVTDAAQPSDEISDGSELSGVTESAESATSPLHVQEELLASGSIHENRSTEGISERPEATTTPTTPHETFKSQSPPLNSDIVQLPSRSTSGNEDMSLETVTTVSPAPSATRASVTAVSPAASDAQDVDMEVAVMSKALEQQMEQSSPPEASPKNKQSPDIVELHVKPMYDVESGQNELTTKETKHQGHEDLSNKHQDDVEAVTGNVNIEVKASGPNDELEYSERANTPTEVGPSEDILNTTERLSSESEEERREPTRRSTRHRKSSVTQGLPFTRKRLRSQARLSESEPRTVADSENEDEPELRDDTPQLEEELSSPFDGVITRHREGKRKASSLDNAESPLDKKRLREDSEPVDDDDTGPSSHNIRGRITRQGTRTEEQVALKRFQNVIGMLHSQISQHRNGNIFHNPIKNSEAPDYHDIVKRPMDLKTIKTRVKDGLIANSLEFQRDIFLMFANSMMYNRPGSDVYAMAEDMMLESEGQISAFRQTEGMVKRGQRP